MRKVFLETFPGGKLLPGNTGEFRFSKVHVSENSQKISWNPQKKFKF